MHTSAPIALAGDDGSKLSSVLALIKLDVSEYAVLVKLNVLV